MTLCQIGVVRMVVQGGAKNAGVNITEHGGKHILTDAKGKEKELNQAEGENTANDMQGRDLGNSEKRYILFSWNNKTAAVLSAASCLRSVKTVVVTTST